MSFIQFERAANLEDSQLKAADASNIRRDYYDVFHHRHEIAAPARRKILEALGWPVDDFNAMEARRADSFERAHVYPLAKTIVIGDQHRAVPVTLDTHSSGQIRIELDLEDGGKLQGEHDTSHLHAWHEVQVGERRWRTYGVPLPHNTPLGYHKLRAWINGHTLGEAQLILCPERCYLPEWLQNGGLTAGFNISLYGLRSRRNWGCGDFTDLRPLIDWARHDVGFSFIGLNPLHAIHNRAPYNTSPYLPNSMYYKNWLYLDIEAVPEFGRSSCAQALLRSGKVQAELHALRDAEYVEYGRIDKLKRSFMRILYREFRRSRHQDAARAQAFDAYCQEEGVLLDKFALYCALDQVLHLQHPNLWTWRQWPADYQDPNSAVCRQFAAEHRRVIEFYKFMQFEIQRQLDAAQAYALEQGMPIGLYHDLAVATDSCGSDLWGHRDFYVEGCRVGAPPDEFSPNGQDWSFPPPNTLAHYANGYHLYRESIRKIVRSGGALRLDHVMRLFRLFWIPEGFSAKEGTYVHDNASDLLHILALESVRAKNIVVGEDLGTVTDEMREGLQRAGVLSYRLFWFEKRTSDGTFKRSYEYPRQALVASSTHDLPTLIGFWTSRDIELRKSAGLVDEHNYNKQREGRVVEKQRILDVLHEEGLLPQGYERDATRIPAVDGALHNAVIGFLGKMPSLIMLLNGEDFTKEEDQQNLPGSTSEYPNWQHKLKVELEEIRSLKWQPFTAMFRHQLQTSGRG